METGPLFILDKRTQYWFILLTRFLLSNELAHLCMQGWHLRHSGWVALSLFKLGNLLSNPHSEIISPRFPLIFCTSTQGMPSFFQLIQSYIWEGFGYVAALLSSPENLLV